MTIKPSVFSSSRLATASIVLCLSACAGHPPQEYPPADTSRWATVSAQYNTSDLRILGVNGASTNAGLSHGRKFLCKDRWNCLLSGDEAHSLEIQFNWDYREKGSNEGEPGIGEQILFGHCLVLFVVCFPVLALAGEVMNARDTEKGLIGECRASLEFTPAASHRYAIQLITSETEAPRVNVFDLKTGEEQAFAVCQ